MCFVLKLCWTCGCSEIVWFVIHFSIKSQGKYPKASCFSDFEMLQKGQQHLSKKKKDCSKLLYDFWKAEKFCRKLNKWICCIFGFLYLLAQRRKEIWNIEDISHIHFSIFISFRLHTVKIGYSLTKCFIFLLGRKHFSFKWNSLVLCRSSIYFLYLLKFFFFLIEMVK